MNLRLDIVAGAELDSEIYAGRITRMALVTNIGVPLWPPDPTVLIQALGAVGMPQKGDSFPHPNYSQYFVKRHIVRALQTSQVMVSIIYEFRGILTVRDSSSLSNVRSQLSTIDFTPFYVTWTPPGGAPISKALTLNSVLPSRHLTVSQTLPYKASTTILDSFACVNDRPWQGLPIGYWLFSDIIGETVDNGITYTYTATFSTKQWEDWSQLGFIQDDNGVPVMIAPTIAEVNALVKKLRLKPYAVGQDTTVNGLTKVGDYPMVDFKKIFGI